MDVSEKNILQTDFERKKILQGNTCHTMAFCCHERLRDKKIVRRPNHPYPPPSPSLSPQKSNGRPLRSAGQNKQELNVHVLKRSECIKCTVVIVTQRLYALLETSATVSFSFAFSTSFTRLFLECSAKTYISFLAASASLQLLIENRRMFS